jgi:hypothetical protein
LAMVQSALISSAVVAAAVAGFWTPVRLWRGVPFAVFAVVSLAAVVALGLQARAYRRRLATADAARV